MFTDIEAALEELFEGILDVVEEKVVIRAAWPVFGLLLSDPSSTRRAEAVALCGRAKNDVQMTTGGIEPPTFGV